MGMTCALTGHRRLGERFQKNALHDKLEEMILAGTDKFLCGMAYGFDLEAGECIADLKREYAVTLTACIPFEGQEARFSLRDQKRYRLLRSVCDEEIVLKPHFCVGCLLARNRYMVDHADLLLAYCEQERGGTAYTLRYAEKKGIPVEYISF